MAGRIAVSGLLPKKNFGDTTFCSQEWIDNDERDEKHREERDYPADPDKERGHEIAVTGFDSEGRPEFYEGKIVSDVVIKPPGSAAKP
jgi:hypothetical protein